LGIFEEMKKPRRKWMPNLNLRHIYDKVFSLYEPFWAYLASKFSKRVEKVKKSLIDKVSKKTQKLIPAKKLQKVIKKNNLKTLMNSKKWTKSIFHHLLLIVFVIDFLATFSTDLQTE
jgi:23S rRNA maturation mini-RNase III